MRELTDQELVRREKAVKLASLGIDPYGQRFDRKDYANDIKERYKDIPHDDFEMSNTTPNWKDLLAVYAVKVTTAHEGAEVVTVDEEKAELIREVFWDMTEIIYETESYEDTDTIETTDEQGNILEQEVTITKTKLIAYTDSKSIYEVISEYNFDESQKQYIEDIIKEDNNNLWSSILY